MTSSQVKLEDALRAAGAGAAETRKRQRFQRALVAGQVAITLALLVGATLMARTFSQLTSVPLGFDPKGAMAISLALPPATISAPPARAEALLRRITAINGVEGAAIASVDPLGPGRNSSFEIPGDQPAGAAAARTASLSMVTPEYFSVLSMRVLRGRPFSEFDNEHGEPVAIVNDLLARATFPGRDPVGQSIHISGESGRRKIVGVVTNTSTTFYNTLAWERKPRYYLPWMQTNTQGWSPVGGGWWIYLRVAKSPAESELRRAVTTWNAEAAVAVVEPMTKAVGDATAQPGLRTTLLGGFGALALMLAALGVYAVISQWVVQRRREIGIRIALGARRPQLLADVLRQAAALVGTGLIAGIPLAMALSRQLRSMLYSVNPLDPAVFVFAAAVLIGTAGMAAYLPARSAANVDPMEALRDE